MDRSNEENGLALHRRVIGCSPGRPGAGGPAVRELRDLALLTAVTTSAPLALVAAQAGAAPRVTLAVSAFATAAAFLTARVFRREYGVGWSLVTFAEGPSPRGRSRGLRLVPRRHDAAADRTPTRLLSRRR
jgi:hypothetical protein